jgi:hypothetical protein
MDETPDYRPDLMDELRVIWDRIVAEIEAIDETRTDA